MGKPCRPVPSCRYEIYDLTRRQSLPCTPTTIPPSHDLLLEGLPKVTARRLLIPATEEAEAGGWQFEASLGNVARSYIKIKF